MKGFSPFLSYWHGEVKPLFTLLQQARVLPLAWKVMPGQQKWEQGQWEIVAHLFERVARLLGEADCTLIADRGLSCLQLIALCQAHGWHYVLRIKQKEYRWRMRVESTFQDLKRRGWQWEPSHVRQLDRLERLLLVLFLAFWWLMHLAACCVQSGRRDRYDRHDRRDKGHLRLVGSTYATLSAAVTMELCANAYPCVGTISNGAFPSVSKKSRREVPLSLARFL